MAAPRRSSSQDEENRPRRWNTEGFLPFRLEVLTPVFVGSGEELSPLEYVIRKEGQHYVLYLVDGAGWLQAQSADSAVSAALSAGDMARLRVLLSERLDVALYAQARLPISLPELGLDLQKRIRDPQSNSKVEVQPFARNAVSGCAFLPGSSLKGSISTPIIDYLDSLQRKAGGPELRACLPYYTSGLKNMFGSIEEHAMQALKVADIAIAPQRTGLVAAQEIKCSADRKNCTPKPPCESLLPADDRDVPLYGSLHLDCRSGQPAVELPGGMVLPWQRLGELCTVFYRERFLNEWKKFYALSHLERVRESLLPIRERVERLDPAQEWLVRVGRYAHIECVTVSHNAPEQKKGYGKTRTLANGMLPFGWAILHFCPQAEYEAGVRAVHEAISDARQEREQQRQRQEVAVRMREEAQAAQQRKKQEAAEREARLADLSPQERAIVALTFEDAGKDDALDLFRQIAIMEAPLRQRAAVALKDFWQASGEWQGKQLSKKQKEKVAQIKSILGE